MMLSRLHARALPSAVRAMSGVAAGDNVGSLGASEVAVKMMAAPLGTKSMRGCGVVTGVGSGVSGIAVDDLVVAKSGLGAFRPVAKASASALAKVPAGIPVEYAGLIGAPCKAAGLLKGLKAGDVVVQSGADTLVGQSVVQMAKAAGITTISIVPSCPDQESVINILQTLGGDIVVPEQYALTWRFTRLLSDVPAPALAINYIASSTPEVPAAGTKPSKLRALVESASPDELTKIKVAMLTAKIASTTVTYGEADAYGDETAAEAYDSIGDVAELMKSNKLSLWVENYPPEDYEYATKKIAGPFCGMRAMVLKFSSECDIEELNWLNEA